MEFAKGHHHADWHTLGGAAVQKFEWLLYRAEDVLGSE
jgi:hypothetical protein